MPKIYKCGGCIRDGLLGIQSKDIDFAFVLDDLDKTVEEGFMEMEKWMLDRGYTIFLSTPEMFTIRGKFPKDHKNAGLVADFVMARKEVGYVPGTRRPILELGTIEDDLIRRDFTLNALAEDEDGQLIDLFGGVADLASKTLRTPLPAEQTMMDDPLRILRSWRFSITKGFEIHPDILETLKNEEIMEKLFKVVSMQRIREELFKMFKFDTVKTLELIQSMELISPGLQKKLFSEMWLKPTFEE
jgi:tRNA nucleotidyltransferase/poly(A) polymerase